MLCKAHAHLWSSLMCLVVTLLILQTLIYSVNLVLEIHAFDILTSSLNLPLTKSVVKIILRTSKNDLKTI